MREIKKEIGTSEVSVQKQLENINKTIRLVKINQLFYFILSMGILNVMFYRINQILKGFTDILQNNSTILQLIIDALDSILLLFYK